jgi:hypothetical protein
MSDLRHLTVSRENLPCKLPKTDKLEGITNRPPSGPLSPFVVSAFHVERRDRASACFS